MLFGPDLASLCDLRNHLDIRIQNPSGKGRKYFQASVSLFLNLSNLRGGKMEGSHKSASPWFLEVNGCGLIPDNLLWSKLLPKENHLPRITHTK